MSRYETGVLCVDTGTQVAKSEEFVRKVEADLSAMRQRAGQLAALLRSRERQLEAARKGVDAAQAAEAQLSAQLQQVCVLTMEGCQYARIRTYL